MGKELHIGILLHEDRQPKHKDNTQDKLELELRSWQKSAAKSLIKLCLKSYLCTFQLYNAVSPLSLSYLELDFLFLVTQYPGDK